MQNRLFSLLNRKNPARALSHERQGILSAFWFQFHLFEAIRGGKRPFRVGRKDGRNRDGLGAETCLPNAIYLTTHIVVEGGAGLLAVLNSREVGRPSSSRKLPVRPAGEPSS